MSEQVAIVVLVLRSVQTRWYHADPSALHYSLETIIQWRGPCMTLDTHVLKIYPAHCRTLMPAYRTAEIAVFIQNSISTFNQKF